jgi:hypothetical protein
MLDSAYLDALQIHNAATLAVSKAHGFGVPAPRVESSQRPRRHGERDTTRFYAGRILSLEGIARGATTAAAWQAIEDLAAALALDGAEQVFKFTRSGLAYAERCLVRAATPLEFELQGIRKQIKWAVSLRAADPRFYADTPTSASYQPSTAGSGISFPISFPLTFTGAAASTMTVTNGGNFPTPPVWTITGPATAPAIRNETTGEQIVTTAALLAGETLTIDVAARTVTLLGSTLRPDLIDAAQTDWFELLAGANVIRLLGSGFAAGQTTLAVSYRDARIS